jgi:AAA15 family ATPase/GTPase
MLLSFRAANVLSIRGEQRLSLVATGLNDGSARPTSIRESGKAVSVLPVIGIYGPNASGKTNILAALRMMRTAVVTSIDWFSKPNPLRRIPFALDGEAAKDPSFFEVDFAINGTRYTYGFELDDERVRGEWLHAYPKGRKQTWFDRGDDGVIEFPGEGLRGEKLDLARRTRRDSLYLTVAAEFNQEQLRPVFEWFRDNLWLITPDWPDRDQRLNYTKNRVIHDPKFRDQVTRLLAVADLGITGIRAVPGTNDQIQFTHRAGEHEIALDFQSESLGTRTWFAMVGGLLEAFGRDQGLTILVDELDASLHPAMCAEAVQMFDDPRANPHGAQMIFTTHDVSLLRTLIGGGRALDRDAIWLTEKTADGATDLYPLSSFDPPPRKDDNIFRKYLLGIYGGTPRVSSGEVAQALEEALA